MKTVQVIFHYQGINRFQVACVEDEFLMYKDVEDIDNDRDYWLTNSMVEQFLAAPFSGPTAAVNELLNNQAQWVIEVTDYTALSPVQFHQSDIEKKQHAVRRAKILAAMSPEDRALFE